MSEAELKSNSSAARSQTATSTLKPKYLRDGGIEIFLRALQPLNNSKSSESVDSGIIISSNEEQPENVQLPSETTHDGIKIFFNEEQPLKAKSEMNVTEEGIVNSIKHGQFMNDL